MERVLELRNAVGLHDMDLDRIWQELKAERRNPELSALRRLEALWGRTPGALNPTALAAQFWRFL